MRWLLIVLTLALLGAVLPVSREGQAAAEFVVYSVYRGVHLGEGQPVPQKDFYINMGSVHGVREGSQLEVMRRVSTYDLMTEQLYRDMTFPIAVVKVIHVEPNASVARLEKMLPAENTPVVTPFAVMVGDLVRLKQPGE